jgi:hypothetical protein
VRNERLLIMVFQQQKGRKLKQVLDGVVSAIKIVKKMAGWSVLGVERNEKC